MSRILLVDDDIQFRRTLHITLNSRGYEVGEAADGSEALDSVIRHPPDLLVLDGHMPRMDGIQTCRAVRASSGVPIIMVSADRSISKERALQAGATDYLAKPFSLNDLLARIESALRH